MPSSAPAEDPAAGDPAAEESVPLVLVRHLRRGAAAGPDSDLPPEPLLRLPLRADERTSLRGHRRSACGRDLLLQLPRGAALEPGDRLAPATGGPQVVVAAAEEPLLVVRAAEPLALLQAAYHLGNRHVPLELHPEELRLGVDTVLEDLLRQRGLAVARILAPFLPEPGAYERPGHAHDHHRAHGHAHSHP